jgi:hypothetical protein
MVGLRLLIILLLLALLPGCSTIIVNYDYDAEMDFTSLKKYDWLSVSEELEFEHLVAKRLKNAIAMNLQSKGILHSAQDPDFVIVLKGWKEEKKDVVHYPEPSYHGYRGYDNHWGGRGHTAVYTYEEGTVIIDLISTATKKLIWRGTGTGIVEPRLSPQERDKRINDAISKLLEDFPPIKPTK